MALVLADRVKETATTEGVGAFNLLGAVANYQTFVDGVGDGNTTYYCIQLLAEGEWEIGLGTVTDAAPDTLSRDTILQSTNADAAVDFSVGTEPVYSNYPADKAIFQDAADATNIGDGTNQVEISSTGDLVCVGSSGLAFGEISAVAAADTIAIALAGKANKIQVTSFYTDGLSNNATPDHTNDHVTITKAGMYLCTVSLHVETDGPGGADTFGFSVYKNNGTGEFANVHAHRKMAGGGGDVGSVSMSGIIDLAATDTIELWCWNEDSADDIVIQDVTLTLFQIGGT